MLVEVCAYQTGWDDGNDGDSIICDSTQEKYGGDAQLRIKALTRKKGFITKNIHYIIKSIDVPHSWVTVYPHFNHSPSLREVIGWTWMNK